MALEALRCEEALRREALEAKVDQLQAEWTYKSYTISDVKRCKDVMKR